MVALVFAAIVAGAAAGFRGPLRHVIEAAPVLYLGKISYGVYVYHLFLPDVAKYVLGSFGFVLDLKGMPYFLTFTAVTIAVASLSWYAFEKPMNDLKRRFPYPSRPRS
jgi:peptidoglycan/LPS O-acetylase OafA/YrhL